MTKKCNIIEIVRKSVLNRRKIIGMFYGIAKVLTMFIHNFIFVKYLLKAINQNEVFIDSNQQKL